MHLSHLPSTVHPITGAVSHPTLWDALDSGAKHISAQERVAYVYQLLSDLHNRHLQLEERILKSPSTQSPAAAPELPDLINITDKAAALKITPHTIVKWFKAHGLKVTKAPKGTDGKVQYLTTTTHWQTFLTNEF